MRSSGSLEAQTNSARRSLNCKPCCTRRNVMKKNIPAKANILGDLRAEYDHAMLETAFYESPDYRSLIESGDRAVIVGRRGAGKSALFYRLRRYWQAAAHTTVITIAPEDYETISI